MTITEEARRAFKNAWNPENRNYQHRCEQFAQVVLAVCLGHVTYEDLETTPEAFAKDQRRFADVVDNIYAANTFDRAA